MKYFVTALFFLCGALWISSQELSDWSGSFEDEAGDSETSEASEDPLAFGGFIDTTLRYYYGKGTFPDNLVDSSLRLGLNLAYTGDITDAVISFRASTRMLYEEDPLQALRSLVDEAYVNISIHDSTLLTIGYHKPIWLSGDELNVAEVFLPLDRRLADTVAYLDRRSAQLLVKSSTYLGNWGLLELLYLPIFEADIFPSASSPWNVLSDDALAAVKEPRTPSLADSQLGARLSASVGSFDLAFLYAYTRLRQAHWEASENALSAHFDPVHVFALETNALAGRFAFWFAASYYLTYDMPGNWSENPVVDHHLRYRGYIEWTMPWSNLVLTGGIEGLQFLVSQEPYFEYAGGEVANLYQDRSELIFRLSDSYFNRALTVSLESGFSLFYYDWYIAASISLFLPDNLHLSLQSVFYEGHEAGIFGRFGTNDFLEISVSYAF